MESKKSIFAEMVADSLGSLPGLSKELFDQVDIYLRLGWGHGLSIEHLKRIDDKEECFASTWARQRRNYFRLLLPKILKQGSRYDVDVADPLNEKGMVLSDREIRQKIKDGYRLMFCPITKIEQINNIVFYENSSYYLLNSDEMCRDLKRSIELHAKPYWYWIDCDKTGSPAFDAKRKGSPSIIEYLIADMVFFDETGKHLDENQYVYTSDTCHSQIEFVLGGHPSLYVTNTKLVANGQYKRICEGNPVYYPIYVRQVEHL